MRLPTLRRAAAARRTGPATIHPATSMAIRSYTDYLKAQGIPVVELGGIPWMKYNQALIPATAIPVHIDLDPAQALAAVKKSRALFLRYTTGPRNSETGWWHMLCRAYDLNRVSANTRSKIRRGLKRLEIQQVEPKWLAHHGYECHAASYARYENAAPLSRQEHASLLGGMDGLPFFEAWTCLSEGELQGYILCLRQADGVFLHTVDIPPSGLKNYAAYGMLHHLLDHYVNDLKIPVSNGSRSISHATEMQDFLVKFGFEREYCGLHIVYRPDIKIAVRILYPFRNMIKYVKFVPVFQKISAVLHQEELARNQPGEST